MSFRDNLDEELGMGMLSNTGRNNDLDNLSISSGESGKTSASASSMGSNGSNPMGMGRPRMNMGDSDLQSNASGMDDAQSVSS